MGVDTNKKNTCSKMLRVYLSSMNTGGMSSTSTTCTVTDAYAVCLCPPLICVRVQVRVRVNVRVIVRVMVRVSVIVQVELSINVRVIVRDRVHGRTVVVKSK